MKYVRYGSDHVLVHDETARALLDMAAVMARADDAQVVQVPILQSGTVGHFEMVIGPASHLSVIDGSAEEGPPELLDEDVLEGIRAHIRRDEPGPVVPQPVPPDETIRFDEGF